MKTKQLLIALAGMILIIVFLIQPASAALNSTVCCEKTNSGLYCQNIPKTECATNFKQAPTACISTSFCKPGVCYNTGQGICTDNTPQLVCNRANGTWSDKPLEQCNLGCCILGDQAAFVTLTRCKYLSATFGLQTNFNKGIGDEIQCVLSVQNQDKGACVYDYEFEKYCKFTTRAECNSGVNTSSVKGVFFKDKLCSAPELGTKCGRSTKTTCIPGKDEVYFADTCGNPSNIYDASKINDEEYWSNVKDKSESCNSDAANANSLACGNCNYLLGSYCRPAKNKVKPSYGTNVCADLNCKTTSNGKSYKHGESWCVYTDSGKTGEGKDSVGSRFYRHICINGEEVVEQCADFRQEECIQDNIDIPQGTFSQAACRVNRWQDCLAQLDQKDCENTDRRDCLWKSSLQVNGSSDGTCVPKNPPGLKFWTSGEAEAICKQASALCVVTFEKDLFGKEKCVDNCDCIEGNWVKQRIEFCTSLGDCGPNVNWKGMEGNKPGYNLSIKKN